MFWAWILLVAASADAATYMHLGVMDCTVLGGSPLTPWLCMAETCLYGPCEADLIRAVGWWYEPWRSCAGCMWPSPPPPPPTKLFMPLSADECMIDGGTMHGDHVCEAEYDTDEIAEYCSIIGCEDKLPEALRRWDRTFAAPVPPPPPFCTGAERRLCRVGSDGEYICKCTADPRTEELDLDEF